MHITSVRLEGFRSFVSASVGFDPHLNVVVGRNGSGKSNLFDAVAFAILCAPCSAKDRMAILHEGSAKSANAMVEVRIGNRDRRLNIDADEVVLRRMIGSKGQGDRLFLQEKTVQRSEWMSFMEVAGLSSCNPYYIIRQGQINELATCNDAKRLSVVEELAGVHTFDQRRKEAIDKIAQGDQMMDEVEESLGVLSRDIEKLQEEQKILKKYGKIDRKKRAIEFVLNEKNTKEHKRKLEMFAKDEEEVKENIEPIKVDLKSEQRKMDIIKKELESVQDKEKQYRAAISSLVESKANEELNIAKLEEKLSLLRDDLLSDKNNQKEGLSLVNALDGEIAPVKNELAEVEEKLQEAIKLDQSLDLELRSKKQRQVDSYAHKCRQFKSKEDKSNWMMGERRRLTADMKHPQETIVTAQGKVEKLHQARIDTLDAQVAMDNGWTELNEEETKLIGQQGLEQSKCAELEAAKQVLIKKKMDLDSKREAIVQRIQRSRARLMEKAGIRPLIVGMESLRVVVEKIGSPEIDDGFLGVVADSFNVTNENLNTAISVTLGQKLFFMVVKTAQLGTKLLGYMKEMRLPGEVHFLALDKLWIPPLQNLPHMTTAEPLIRFINLREDCPPDALKAIQFLFGKVMLVKSPEVFADLRDVPVDCVTLDGDQAFRKGVMKGGYYRPGSSLLQLYRDMSPDNDNGHELDEKIRLLESNYNNILEKDQNLRTMLSRLRFDKDKLKSKKRLVSKSLVETEAELEKEKEILHQSKVTAAELQEKMDLLKCLEDDSQWVPSSTQCLSLINEIDDLKRRCKAAFTAKNLVLKERNLLQAKLNSLTSKLNDLEEEMPQEKNLCRLQNDINIIKIKLDSSRQLIKETQAQLSKTEERLQRVSAKLTDHTVKCKEVTAKMDELKSELSHWSGKREALLLRRQSVKEAMERSAATAASAATVPGEAEIRHVSEWSRKRLFAELQALRKRIQREFGLVNKQSLEQFTEANAALADFENRRKQLIKDKRALVELVETLVAQRQNKVNFTFNQMSKYFTEIFRELVPLGNAALSYTLPDTASVTSPSSETSISQQNPVGLSLSVRFSEGQHMTELNHLSGGQKSIVSLAFIFAIQKCDPSPFYILDEVDAALDVGHRRKVVEWIRKQKQQFICTTFRREFLAAADCFIGIKFANKVSHAGIVTKEEAQGFMLPSEQEEQEGSTQGSG